MRIRCGRIILLAVLAALGSSNSARAQALWQARHGITWKDLGTWLKEEADGYRLVYVNGYDVGGSPLYAAVAVKNKENHPWHYWTGTLETLRRKDAEQQAKGFRPICVFGHLTYGEPGFTAVWVKDGRPVRERIAFHLTEKDYRERVKQERDHDYMPRIVTGYADGAGSYRFTALFVPAEKVTWDEQHDLTDQEYQQAIDNYKAKKFRPISNTVYPTPAGPRFAAIFLKDGLYWHARHKCLAAEYQDEFDKFSKNGYKPVSVAGYRDNNTLGPEIFDWLMRLYMEARGISAGTLAVSRDGKLLFARGYGFADAERRRRIEPDDPLRLASVTKPFTAAAIYRLVGEGKLSLDARAFPLLGLQPPPKKRRDRRLNNITIRHLLEHKGGWDRAKSFDPMFRPLVIAADLKGPGPAAPVDIIRYMMGQPLQFDPGTEVSYSNFGYCVLGRVIEKVSGQTYLAYVREHICAPLGIRSVELGRSLPKYRNPREPVYRSPGKWRNLFDPESNEQVPAPDGTFYLEAMDAHGGLIASSRDVVRFLDAYWMSGEPRQIKGRAYCHFGQLPGTFTMAMQRTNGVNIAALFNQEADPSGLNYHTIRDLMQEAADRQTGGGLRYAAIWVKSE